MLAKETLAQLLTVLIYGMAILIGAIALAPSSTGLLIVLPLAVAVVIIAHAIATKHLNELGYAIVGLYGALLLLSVTLGILQELVPPRGVRPFDPVGLPGVVGVAIFVTGAYLLAIRYVERATRGSRP